MKPTRHAMNLQTAAALWLQHVHDGGQPHPAPYSYLQSAFAVLRAHGVDPLDRTALCETIVNTATPEQLAAIEAEKGHQ